MADSTEGRESSFTSRHVEARARSARVRVLEVDAEVEEVLRRSRSDSRMTESGFSRFLKGSRVSSSELGSGRRRFFFLSSI